VQDLHLHEELAPGLDLLHVSAPEQGAHLEKDARCGPDACCYLISVNGEPVCTNKYVHTADQRDYV
jgi:hypothetical protein